MIEYFLLLHSFLLFHRERPEELNLLLVGRPPLIVDLEGRLEVLLDFYIEGLRLDIDEGRVVHSWHGLGRHQVVQVARELRKFRPRRLLLPLLLLDLHLTLVLLQLLTHLFVLVLHVIQVGLACVEIMLVLTTVVAAVTIIKRLATGALMKRLIMKLGRVIFKLTISV